MTNCEKFNAMLNSCRDPQAMYDALYALAPVVREARSEIKEEIKMDAAEMKKAAAETPNFFRLARELSKFKSVSAISKCRFSPKWNAVFCRAVYRCYTALYTTSLAGLKPVKP